MKSLLSLTEREMVALETVPPVAARAFAERMAIHPDTLRHWSKKGVVKLVNIFGQMYVTAESAATFNRRVAAGEFARDIRPPVGKGRRQRREGGAA